MISGKSILAIIPARGGSKGIPKKNIAPLAGKPLILWTIEAAKDAKYLDRVILSSEDDEIIDLAERQGLEVPFKRPKELALDSTPGIDPVIHALETLPQKYDYVVLLQPTSPLRSAGDIDACIEQCLSDYYDSCVSVSEPDKSPYWMFTETGDHKLVPLLKTDAVRRQDLPEVFALNGAVYVAKTGFVLRERKLIGENTTFTVMPKERSIDIDDQIDLELAEILLKSTGKNI